LARRLLEAGIGNVVIPALETSVIDSPSGARRQAASATRSRDPVTDGD
jgi:hypothetical protein